MIGGTAQKVSTLFRTVGHWKAPDHGGKRRTDARDAALAFERFEQRRFLAALVGARAGVRVQIEIEARALNVLAQLALGVRFGDGVIHDVDQVAIFAADVDVALRARRPRGRR